MTRTFRCLALFVGFVFLITAATTQSLGQDEKDKKGKKDKPLTLLVIEATEKATKWGVSDAKVGIKIYTDRDYVLAALPKEMVGGTFVTRGSGELREWLPSGTLKAKMAVTAYAIVLVKYLGKDKFDEEKQKLFVKEGWKEVEGKVRTTFPTGEGWEWKAYKMDVDEGDIFLQLKDLSWDKHGTNVLYLFTKREKAKS